MADTFTIIACLLTGFFAGFITAYLLRIISFNVAKSFFEKFSMERQLANQELNAQQSQFQVQMQTMAGKLDQVSNVVREFEKDRSEKFGELASRLKETNHQTSELIQLTGKIKETMGGSQSRGQLGEKIADDILRFAGFVEGINFTRQTSIDQIGSRPDFTFILPNKQCLNMDVKFPFARFNKMFEEQNAAEKERLKREFFADVKLRVKEVTSRSYINLEQNTVDCVIMFIPSEHVYAFLQSENPELIEFALQQRVICCSPMTLFPVLSVIRQSVEQFAMQQASKEVLKLVFDFKKQWEKFVEKLEGVGSKIIALQKDYDHLIGTRRTQLDRTLIKMDAMKHLQIEEEAE